MRKVMNKSTAIRAIVLILALIGILSIWPARIYTTVLETSGGGTIVGESDRINFENNQLMQEFIARYDRLSSIDLYVTKVENGRYISCLLYDENGSIIFNTFVDTQGCELPGYINIPMEVNVEVGKSYAIKLQDCRSKYYVAFEDVPADSAYVGSLTNNYENIEGRHLAAKYNYRLPISKSISLMLMAVIAVAAAVIYALCGLFFKKNPEKDSIVTFEKAMSYTLNPLMGLVFAVLMIMVFPLKMFDSRPLDIIFYEVGLLITAAIVFYAINHKVVTHEIGVSFWQSLKNDDRVQYVCIMFSMAMALWYACAYMNDLYDIYHKISETHMTFWLLIMMLFTFTLKETFTAYNLAWLVLSGAYGIYYYNVNKLAETEKEFDLQNLVLKYQIMIVILAGFLVLNFIRIIVLKIKDKKYYNGSKMFSIRPTVFGVMLLVLFALLIIFRNTRTWGISLSVMFLCFYLRLGAWGKKKDYYKILSGGLMMNFAISLIYCYMHRYFAGYTSGRFAFLFHTVTITAEYFTFMGAAAAVMLLVKIVSLPKGTSFKDGFIIAWKEMVLFGFTMSYAIFTVSRTAYLAIAATLLFIICVVISYNKKQFVRIVAGFIVSLIICFPSAFTLQRILPTMVADPVFYVIDDTDSFIRGGADWDNTNFMCVERFLNLFESKILGVDVGIYEYPVDRYNYEDGGKGEPLYDYYGRPYDESPDNPKNQENPETDTQTNPENTDTGRIDPPYADKLLASSVFTTAEYTMLLDEMAGYVDESNALDVISNGRITIYRSYIQQLNMWGHDEMGALLPNGEIAVHAHDTYLQVAYDHGIVVGIYYAVTMIAALIAAINYYRENRDREALSLLSCAIVIGFMVAGISEWVFQYCNPMTVALMLAIAPLTFKVRENG